jgi:hypothetical protein
MRLKWAGALPVVHPWLGGSRSLGRGALLSGCRVPTWPEDRWQFNLAYLAYLATGLDLDQAASASWRSYAG